MLVSWQWFYHKSLVTYKFFNASANSLAGNFSIILWYIIKIQKVDHMFQWPLLLVVIAWFKRALFLRITDKSYSDNKVNAYRPRYLSMFNDTNPTNKNDSIIRRQSWGKMMTLKYLIKLLNWRVYMMTIGLWNWPGWNDRKTYNTSLAVVRPSEKCSHSYHQTLEYVIQHSPAPTSR